MSKISLVGVVFVLLIAAPSYAQSPSLLSFSQLNDIKLVQEKRQLDGTQDYITDRLSLDVFGRTLELELWNNARVTKHLDTDSGIRVLKGRVSGIPQSWARLTAFEGKLQGAVFDGENIFTIEYIDDKHSFFAQTAKGHVIYNADDVLIPEGTMSCGAHPESQSVSGLVQELSQAVAKTPAASQEIQLSVVGDAQFVQDFGANAESALISRFNIVDGIFSEQIGVQLTIQSITFEQDGDNTFTTNDASDLLSELTDFRRGNPTLSSTGLTHMYTGRNLDGTTVGIAFLGAICSTNFGTGLSMAGINLTTDTLIAAHEIGHNFGAFHDGESGSPCESVTGNFLMSPSVNGSDTFSQCSLDSIQAEIATANCLSPLSSVDLALTGSQNQTALLNQDFNLQFAITNNGTEIANNVSFEVTIPSQLDAIAATPSSGTCTQAAGGFACGLGAIAGGANASVVLSLRGNTASTTNINASVTGDGDTSTNNNSFTTLVEIEPVVDLGISLDSPSTSVTVNSTATTSFTVQNTGDIAANGVQLTLQAPTSHDITNVTGDGATCNIAGKQATCSLGSIIANSSRSITVTVLGINVATEALQISVTSSATDTNPGNDSASKQIAVQPQPSTNGTGDSSGGGAFGWLLLLLGSFGLQRRRRLHPLQ